MAIRGPFIGNSIGLVSCESQKTGLLAEGFGLISGKQA